MPVTTPAAPFYESGWFIALLAVLGSLVVLGVLGGLGYYVYTKMKSSAPAEAETQESNTMELQSSRRRIMYRSQAILNFI